MCEMVLMRPIRRDSAENYADVFRILNETPSYTELIEGRLPIREDVDDFFVGVPPDKSLEDKSTFGFFSGFEMVGCAETMRSYPTSASVWIGLLLITQSRQGQGLGKEALALLIEEISNWGYVQLQIGVVSTNHGGYNFWRRNGFKDLRRVVNNRFTGEMIVMELNMARHSGVP